MRFESRALSNTRKTVALALAGLFVSGCSSYQAADTGLKSGHQVYTETCSVCHAEGVNNAPRYADKAAWAKLLEEGQVILSAHGWVGMGGMPPQGGNPNLTLQEFSRAVTHMARGAGADWQDPDAAMLQEIQQEILLRRKELAGKPR